jgi:hypothetical protein
MWAAFVARLGTWFSTYVVKYVVRYILDHFTAWIERRSKMEAQKKKDEENKKKYDQAVLNGTNEDVIKATEDLLNK